MEAIILAGGFGKRLRSKISKIPKPMAPINGKPFLELLIRQLARNGFERVILSIGYKGQQIVEYFGDQFNGVPIEYSWEKSPLGTGGAVKKSLEKSSKTEIFVVNGDTYVDVNYIEAMNFFKENYMTTVVINELEETNRYGKVIYQNDLAVEFLEKSSKGKGFINAGVYIFKTNAFDDYLADVPFSLEKEFLIPSVKKRTVRVFKNTGLFVDIGTPEDYELAKKVFISR